MSETSEKNTRIIFSSLHFCAELNFFTRMLYKTRYLAQVSIHRIETSIFYAEKIVTYFENGKNESNLIK